MNKEIIKLHNRAGIIALWASFGVCFAIGATVIIVDRFFLIRDDAFDVVGAVFRWIAAAGFFFGASVMLYSALVCGKLVIDFDKEEFWVYKLFSTKRLSFRSVITVQRGVHPAARGSSYCIVFWLDSGKTVMSGIGLDYDGQANEALAKKLKKIVDSSRR